MLKNLPANAKDVVRSLGWKDPREEDMAMHCVLAWKIPWTEELGGLQSMSVTEESDAT